ncbi:MAG: hypothetical protein AB7E80_16205 [Hyphomicrobiaceae bacterium]
MTQPLALVSPDMTEAERLLAVALARGEAAVLGGRSVRGSVLRAILVELRSVSELQQEAGVRIERAVVTGGLDLEGCAIDRPLTLRSVRIGARDDGPALNLRDARLERLTLHDLTVSGDVVADRCDLDGGLLIGGGRIDGLLFMRGASVRGALAIEGADVGTGAAAIYAAGLDVSGALLLRRSTMRGDVSLSRAVVGAGLFAEDCRLMADGPATLDLAAARISGDVVLERAVMAGLVLDGAAIGGSLGAAVARFGVAGVRADGVRVANRANFSGARIDGTLAIEGARIGGGLAAQGLEVHGGQIGVAAGLLRVAGHVDLSGAKLVGQVRCPAAEIGGDLNLAGARMFGAGVAMSGAGLAVRGDLVLSRSVVVGRIELAGARIERSLDLSAAALKVERGVALAAPGVHIGADVRMDRGFRSVGGIAASRATIGGVVNLKSSGIVSCALAHRPSRELAGASFDDEADAGRHDVALDLGEARVAHLAMPETAEHRPRGIIDLSRASIATLEDHAAAWPPPFEARSGGDEDYDDIDHLVLDGLVYERLANPDGRSDGAVGDEAASAGLLRVNAMPWRVEWLESQSHDDVVMHMRQQPWQQLAGYLTRHGRASEALLIDIARRRRAAGSPSVSRGRRFISRLLDVIALYGHSPWRVVGWMAAVIAVCGMLYTSAAAECTRADCTDETVYVLTGRGSHVSQQSEAHYPSFNGFAYSLDVFLPGISLGYDDHWRPNPSWVREVSSGAVKSDAKSTPLLHARLPAGAMITTLMVIERVLGLLLTVLAAASFTGVLTRFE